MDDESGESMKQIKEVPLRVTSCESEWMGEISSWLTERSTDKPAYTQRDSPAGRTGLLTA